MPIHEVFPYLCVRDAKAALDFYARVFDGKELFRLVEPSGRIGHCEIKLGDMTLMMSEEFPEHGIRAPQGDARPPFLLHLHVDDCDALMANAVAAGATVIRPASDAFYGERSGRIRDPFGHEWLIGHSIEKVSPDEMQRRYTALFAQA